MTQFIIYVKVKSYYVDELGREMHEYTMRDVDLMRGSIDEFLRSLSMENSEIVQFWGAITFEEAATIAFADGMKMNSPIDREGNPITTQDERMEEAEADGMRLTAKLWAERRLERSQNKEREAG